MKKKIIGILVMMLLITTLIININSAEAVKLDYKKNDFVKMNGLTTQETEIINNIVTNNRTYEVNPQALSNNEIVFTPPYDDDLESTAGYYDPGDWDKWDANGFAYKSTGKCEVWSTCAGAESAGWMCGLAGVAGKFTVSQDWDNAKLYLYCLAKFMVVCGSGFDGFSEFKIMYIFYEDGEILSERVLKTYWRTSGGEEYNEDFTNDPIVTYIGNLKAGSTYEMWVWAWAKTKSYGGGYSSYVDCGVNPDRYFRVTKMRIELHTPTAFIEISPSNYDFGNVDVDFSKSKTFTVTNTGDYSAYEIESRRKHGSSDFEVVSGAYKEYLAPGDSFSVGVKFSPSSSGEKKAAIISSGENTNYVNSYLSGTGTKTFCCFPAGTKITMADGSYKNIEDTKIGDYVLSYDLRYNKFTSWSVKMLGHPPGDTYEINDGLISLTGEHPLYIKKVDGKTGWGAIRVNTKAVRIKEEILSIEVGDQLFTSDKEWIEVTKITHHSEPVQTYNILSFSGTKTYFANGILVYEEHPPVPYMIKWRLERLSKRFSNAFPMLKYLLEL